MENKNDDLHNEHGAGTQWGNRKYMNMRHLEAAFSDPSIA